LNRKECAYRDIQIKKMLGLILINSRGLSVPVQKPGEPF